MIESFDFGIPWAEDGENRSQRRRTPLAWADGAGKGALLVQDGAAGGPRHWMLWSEWEDWVARTHARPERPGTQVDPSELSDVEWDALSTEPKPSTVVPTDPSLIGTTSDWMKHT